MGCEGVTIGAVRWVNGDDRFRQRMEASVACRRVPTATNNWANATANDNGMRAAA